MSAPASHAEGVRISVIGCGYLGAVHAACMASLGHDVIGIDVAPDKVDSLNAGRAPFYEPGFEPVLTEQLAAGRLRFSTSFDDLRDADVHFLAVGTPQTQGRYAADLRYVHAAVESFLDACDDSRGPVVLAGKSTVPVGTAERIHERAAESGKDIIVTWNPEFLREGFAVEDTLRPNRIVYGLCEDEARAAIASGMLDACYADLLAADTPCIRTNYATAELVKVAANSFLATKISFINAMAELCDAAGADVTELAEAIGYDGRIGRRFLRAGLGFGGGCLPKDIRAFMARAGELGVDEALTFLREVDAINTRQRQKVVDMTEQMLAGRLRDHSVAVLGAAFKPNSDDLRDSPALDVAQRIWARGAELTITDPAAADNLRRKRPNLRVVDSVAEAVRDVDIVLLLTEWDEYRALDPDKLACLVRQRKIIDARNVLDPKRWIDAGWEYRGMGRSR